MGLESVRTLMRGLIDYAGLFPPAGLSMSEAAGNYRRYAMDSEKWMLGRFVLPASRLQELETVLVSEPPPDRWSLSVVTGADVMPAVNAALAFNAHVRDAQVDAIEAKPASPAQILEHTGAIPDSFAVYWETPFDSDPAPWIEAIAALGHRAKIRTGGIEENQFPQSRQIARFIRECDRSKTKFKATAGLHHGVRGVHRLTYEDNAPSCAMHGFLNVFLAAAFLWAGISEDEMEQLLNDGGDSFRFSRMGVAWRRQWISNAQIGSARDRLAHSFGSCSFEEPLAELKAMRLL